MGGSSFVTSRYGQNPEVVFHENLHQDMVTTSLPLRCQQQKLKKYISMMTKNCEIALRKAKCNFSPVRSNALNLFILSYFFTMPVLHCCISNCKTRLSPSVKIKCVGQPQFWPQLQQFVKDWQNYSKSDVICGKHHAQV